MGGGGEGKSVGEREGERERSSGLSQSVRVFVFFHLFSCNGPCAPKEKWHIKEHIIIIIISRWCLNHVSPAELDENFRVPHFSQK